MNTISNYNVKGDFVDLKVSHQKHISGDKISSINDEKNPDSFGAMFSKMVDNVNNMELKSTDLANKMAVDPDSVDIHDVQIASEQAEMGILMTKGIIDRVIRAYREITNLR